MKNNRYFSLTKPEEEKSKSSSEQFISKYLSIHYQKIKNLHEDLQRLPSPEEIFFLQTDTAFNAFTFIPLIARHQGIKELRATTYSINKRVIDALIELHDGGLVDKITLMISDSMIQRNTSTTEHLAALVQSRPNIRILYAWVHAKVCTIKTEHNHFVVEGSGNWSENAQYEQYTFINSLQAYEFRNKIFNDAIIKHAINNIHTV